MILQGSELLPCHTKHPAKLELVSTEISGSFVVGIHGSKSMPTVANCYYSCYKPSIVKKKINISQVSGSQHTLFTLSSLTKLTDFNGTRISPTTLKEPNKKHCINIWAACTIEKYRRTVFLELSHMWEIYFFL